MESTIGMAQNVSPLLLNISLLFLYLHYILYFTILITVIIYGESKRMVSGTNF